MQTLLYADNIYTEGNLMPPNVMSQHTDFDMCTLSVVHTHTHKYVSTPYKERTCDVDVLEVFLAYEVYNVVKNKFGLSKRGCRVTDL